MSTGAPPPITIRHDLRPGDLGRVVELHGVLYASEYGFDHTFEAYVAEDIGRFGPGFQRGLDRLWLAELDGRLLGSIAIARRAGGEAQLRWFLLHPGARGVIIEGIVKTRQAGQCVRDAECWRSPSCG